MYERVLAELDPAGDIVALEGHGEGPRPPWRPRRSPFKTPWRWLSSQTPKQWPVLIPEGTSRGSDDVTVTFGEKARGGGLHVVQLKTL